LRKKLIDKYNEFKKNEKVKIDGTQILANLINMLPYDKSSEFFDNLKSTDIDLAAEIKDKILLLEDIIKLDDNIIKGIIFNIDHAQLALFLASVDNDIKEKFFRNMSVRSQDILKEDLDNLGELSAEEKFKAVNDVLKSIRTLLNYI
jgi:flagellar motor switch protein FliG